jgi:hypothetical protein
MNDHGTMTIELCDTNETRHICKYATSELRHHLASLSAETEIPVAMSRIGVRSNVWRAEAVVENRSAETAVTEPDEQVKQPL